VDVIQTTSASNCDVDADRRESGALDQALAAIAPALLVLGASQRTLA
jgi:hypothetical protein